MVKIEIFPPLADLLTKKEVFLTLEEPMNIIDFILWAKELHPDVSRAFTSVGKIANPSDLLHYFLVLKNNEIATKDEYVMENDLIKLILPLQGG